MNNQIVKFLYEKSFYKVKNLIFIFSLILFIATALILYLINIKILDIGNLIFITSAFKSMLNSCYYYLLIYNYILIRIIIVIFFIYNSIKLYLFINQSK